MENIKKGTPKDVFLHLLAVVTLYVSVVAFITLWWQYINTLFPDPLLCGSCVYDPIRLAMAALIVVFPIHILIAWLIGREFRADPEKREMRVRKWLWYLTLFIAAVTIIIDLVVLINNFLRGDLTIQFFLKILVVLATTAAVFGYYLWDLRKRRGASNKPKIIAWTVGAVILASIIYGFFLIGSPATQRAKRFDEQRINDLSIIQNEIVSYWQQKAILPVSLDNLKNQISGFMPPADPETKQPYEYEAIARLSFKLCATFKTPFTSEMITQVYPYSPNSNWNHARGHVCFDRTIDPQIYKPNASGAPVPTPVPLKY